jgi:hypothetical protein
MMEEALARGWENLVGRWEGPMSFRLIASRRWRSFLRSGQDGGALARPEAQTSVAVIVASSIMTTAAGQKLRSIGAGPIR